jgi:protein TonB
MIESTARAERFDLQTSTSSTYLWEAPQKPVAVRIPFGMMDRLEREAVEAFRSLSSRGSEIGGLLLGDVTAASPLVVTLADYELITCDYARGPLYRLAEADMERFQRAMEQRKSLGMTVAGFFRSHTRKGISLDADDLAFFQACFREAHHIALLVRPFATKASTAGIFIWEAGKVHGDSSYLEFPFRSSELGGKPGDGPEAKSATPPSAPPVQAPKASARAQIVPIASRRDISMAPPAPTPEAVVPEPAVAPPPSPAAVAATPVAAPAEPPKVEQKPVVPQPVEQRPNRTDRGPDRTSTPDRSERTDRFAKKDRPAEPSKAAPPKPAAKPEPLKPAEPVKPVETAKAAEPPRPAKALEQPKTAEPAKKEAPKPAEPAKSKELSKPVQVEVEVEASRSGKGFKLVLAAATTIVLFVLFFVYPGLLRKSTKTPTATGGDSSPLQLHVERTNGELLLTWNRDSDAIRNATKAVLKITDGEQTENVDMDMTQLRNNGSIVYSPTSSDVSFQMEVTGRDQAKITSESVRSLRARPSPMQDGQPAADPKPAPAPTTAPAPPTPAAAAPAKQPGNENKPAEEQAAPAPAPEEPARPVVARRAFAAESLSSRIRPATSADIPDAPIVGGVTAPIPGVNLGNLGATPSAPGPAPAAPSSSSSSPGSDPKNVKQGGQIQQAVLIARKEPEYPKIAKQTGAKGMVTLSATIGKDGKLRNIKVVSGHPMLQNAAIEAVKQWIYRPTLLNGTPVETDTQIQLNFVGDR